MSRPHLCMLASAFVVNVLPFELSGCTRIDKGALFGIHAPTGPSTEMNSCCPGTHEVVVFHIAFHRRTFSR